MNSTSNCSCFENVQDFDILSNNTASNEPSSPKNGDLYGAILFLGIYALLVLFMICWCIYLIYAKFRSYRLGPLTTSPVVPGWLGPRGPRRNRYFKDFGVVVQTRDYRIKFTSDKRDSGERTQGAVKWIRRILKKRFGKDSNGTPNVYVSNSTCLVSVPMENFKCGQEPTDFKPISGAVPGSQFTYQMCGDNRIQITRYVERGVVYVAGYCVYIRDPYARKVNYNIKHIQKCYKGPRYVLPEPTCPMALEEDSEDSEDDKDSDSESESTLQKTIPLLKAQYCKIAREPVLIGWESGILKHFRWNRDTRSFKTSNCFSCEAVGDNPPAYHLLDV